MTFELVIAITIGKGLNQPSRRDPHWLENSSKSVAQERPVKPDL
jgi:hypothetical protein